MADPVPPVSPFSTPTITHIFFNADGTLASGKVEFTLGKRITNSGASILPGSVTVALDETGSISVKLTSNLDDGTLPSDTNWRVDFQIMGAELDTEYIQVPSGAGPFDLASLFIDVAGTA